MTDPAMASDLTPDALAEIARVTDAATPGAWIAETGAYEDLHFGNLGQGAGVNLRDSDENGRGRLGFFAAGFRPEDAEFIALARTAIPDLLAALTAKDEEIAELVAALDLLNSAWADYALGVTMNPEGAEIRADAMARILEARGTRARQLLARIETP